jgi:hypothetical protein
MGKDGTLLTPIADTNDVDQFAQTIEKALQ